MVTPVGPLGDWRAASPRFLSVGAETELIGRFDPFPAYAPASGGGGEAVTDLDFELFGTRENRGSGVGSAIIAGPDGVQASYAVGDEVAPGVRLGAVAFDHVILDRGGVRERLYLDNSIPAETIGPGPIAATATPTSVNTPDLSFVARRSGGQITGIALPPTVEPGLAALVGLRQGDIITAVNGVPVRAQADIDQLKAALRPGASLTLQVERGGSTVPVTVNL